MHRLFAQSLRSLIELLWVIPRKMKKSLDSDNADFAWEALFLMPIFVVFAFLVSCGSATVLLFGALIVVSVWATMTVLESGILTRLFVLSEAIGKLLVSMRLVEDIGETTNQIIYGRRVGFTGATIASLAFAFWQIMGVGLAFLYRILRGKKVHDNPDISSSSGPDHKANFADVFGAGVGAFMNAASNAWGP